VIFAGAIAWLIVGFVSFANTVNNLQRVPLPAGGAVSLNHTGSFIVYYEGPGASTGSVPPFHINVAPASPGAAVSSLTPYRTSVFYSVGSHQGRAVLTLHVTKPGVFKITAIGQRVPGAGLAIGGSIASSIVGILLPSVPLMVLAGLGAVLVLIFRVRRKRALQRQYG